MKYVKIILALIIVIPAIGGLAYFSMNMERLEFESICKKGHKRYTKLCKNVGKDAWSQVSVLQINAKNYGKILGVAWRKKGSIISSRIHKKKRRSENNSYYYIIGDAKVPNSQFLRRTDETEAHPPGYNPKNALPKRKR